MDTVLYIVIVSIKADKNTQKKYALEGTILKAGLCSNIISVLRRKESTARPSAYQKTANQQLLLISSNFLESNFAFSL